MEKGILYNYTLPILPPLLLKERGPGGEVNFMID
jgi:hypothetical protein